MDLSGPVLTGFGIPTVDFSYLASDKSIIEKYNLINDSQCEKSFEFLDALRRDFCREKYTRKQLVGGNSQISLMVFQSLLEIPYRTMMCGAVGDDTEGIFVKNYLKEKYVRTNMDTIENTRTATSVIVVHKDSRTIAVANGAGDKYTFEDCTKLSSMLKTAKSSSIVLFEGFFLGLSYDIAVPLISVCKRNGSIIAINISGVYMIEKHFSEFLSCMTKCDLMIGNRSEFDILSKFIGLTSKSIIKNMRSVHKMMLSDTSNISRRLSGAAEWKKILIVTNNKEPVYCIHGNGELIVFNVPGVAEDKIVDTCGAGDSFLGGFLYGLVKGYSIRKCLETGTLVSSHIIQQHGYDIRPGFLSD